MIEGFACHTNLSVLSPQGEAIADGHSPLAYFFRPKKAPPDDSAEVRVVNPPDNT